MIIWSTGRGCRDKLASPSTGSEDELVLPVADNWEPRAQEEPPVEIFEYPEHLLWKGIRHLLLYCMLPQSWVTSIAN